MKAKRLSMGFAGSALGERWKGQIFAETRQPNFPPNPESGQVLVNANIPSVLYCGVTVDCDHQYREIKLPGAPQQSTFNGKVVRALNNSREAQSPISATATKPPGRLVDL